MEDDFLIEVRQLRSQMINMMESLFTRGRPSPVRGPRFKPPMDIYETDSDFVIVMEMAGAERQDIDVHLEGRRLRITGTRRVAAPLDAQRCHQMEIEFGSFERSVNLDFVPPRDSIEAIYQDGFLQITLPKRREPGDTTVKILTE